MNSGDASAGWLTRQDLRRSWKPWLRGTALGFPLGALPAGGAEIPTFLSYAAERKLTKHPEEFGKGAIEGVAGPEAANNASAAGVLVPMLTLGLPTSATAAIMLAAFQSYGINPGPLLLQSQSLAAEQYRSLRTRLKRAEGSRNVRTIAITSPAKGDGKSLTAANLALTMAQDFQQRVVLVDGDLRRPSVHRLFGVPATFRRCVRGTAVCCSGLGTPKQL